ncbi:MAG: HNH endonuclease [Treponema sp.]|nr:HNH endonuclease [Treponema sp.]
MPIGIHNNLLVFTEHYGKRKLRQGKSRKNDEFYTQYADHATAWSKGGVTDISNCVMLCKTHNRSKGNR